ncbi:glutathione S-transferase family protein [Microbacteriaceae bacterium K1510]|nr:glutathione S-transferase family protein [Microbacteriaceae bacterium K1510]
MPTLYDYILCDDCYKVRLLLSMLSVSYETRKVDVHPGRENLSPAFLSVNPLGRIPVLVDGDLVLRGPSAILTYIAAQYDPSRRFLPEGAAVAAQVTMWLSFAETELTAISAIRAHELFRLVPDMDRAALRRRADRAMEVLEDHLAEGEIVGRRWVVADQPTIADLSLFPPVALSAEAGLPLEPYPAVWRWLYRVKNLPGFIVMPGVLPLLPKVAA